MAKDMDGNTIKVGDEVGFKDDYEKYGTIKSIKKSPYSSGHTIVIDEWDGHGTHNTHYMDSDRVWLE